MNKEKHVISLYNIQWCGEENENNRKTCHQPSGSGHEAPDRSSFRAVALAGHRNENPGGTPPFGDVIMNPTLFSSTYGYVSVSLTSPE